MGRDDDTPRPIPMRPPRRDTPPTKPSPARGPAPPPRIEYAKEPLQPTLATVYGVAKVTHDAVVTLAARFDALETAVRPRESAPPSDVISLTTPLPSLGELLDQPASSKPASRPSMPARAAKATGHAAKAVSKNRVVRGLLLAAGVFPWVAQVVAWFRQVDVGPIVSGLRLIADAIEGLGK